MLKGKRLSEKIEITLSLSDDIMSITYLLGNEKDPLETPWVTFVEPLESQQ